MIDKKKLNCYLNKNKEELSKTEQKIHQYVLDNPEQIVYDSISSLSEKLEVGEATIVRYFKKLGYVNFNVFKMSIFKACEELRVEKNAPFIENITENMINTINNTKSILNNEELKKATNLIVNSDILFVAGAGASKSSAIDMYCKIIKLGINTVIHEDNYFANMYTTVMKKNGVALIYSFSGETVEMIKLAENCKKNNIKIIVISNYAKSSLVSYADVFLQTAGFENDIKGGFFSSKISQTYISDILVTSCALANISKTKKHTQEIIDVLM